MALDHGVTKGSLAIAKALTAGLLKRTLSNQKG